MRAAYADAEISKYFASGKSSERRRTNHEENRHRRLCVPFFQQPRTPQSLIKVPGSPFLVYGSCGPSSASPVKKIKRLDAGCRVSGFRKNTTSPTQETSYYTWSPSSPGRFRAVEKRRITSKSSIEVEPHLKENTSPRSILMREASESRDRIREQQPSIEQARPSSQSLSLNLYNVAKEQVLDQNSAAHDQRQVSREKEPPPKSCQDIRATETHDEHAILEKPASCDNSTDHPPPFLENSQQARTLKPSQGLFSKTNSSKQKLKEDQAPNLASTSVHTKEQSSPKSISDAELDTLLDQCARCPNLDSVNYNGCQDTENDAPLATATAQTQLGDSQGLQETNVVQSAASTKVL